MSKKNSNNIDNQKQFGEELSKPNQDNHRRKKFIIPILIVLALAIIAFIVIPDGISKNNYAKGVQAITRGNYEEAILLLEKSNVNEAAEQLQYVVSYQKSLKAYKAKDYKEAYEEISLIHEDYYGYGEVQELSKNILSKLCGELLEEAKYFFEKGEYIDAYDYLLQVFMYDEGYEDALQLLDSYREQADVMEAEKSDHGYFLVEANSIRQREYVNINQWHDAGYTGKGLTILQDDTGNTMHSYNCQDIIQTILPDAKVIRGLISGRTNSQGVVEASVTHYNNGHIKMSFDEFIVKYNVTMINNSKNGGKGNADSDWSVWMKRKIKEYNLIGFGAAGNGGDIDNRFYGSFIMVSGVYLKDDGTILNYGAKGDIDFSMFMGFQSGTSFASPFLCGMAGLLREKYPEISQEEVYEYFKSHSQKLGDEGKNIDYGWGIPILGNPDE